VYYFLTKNLSCERVIGRVHVTLLGKLARRGLPRRETLKNYCHAIGYHSNIAAPAINQGPGQSANQFFLSFLKESVSGLYAGTVQISDLNVPILVYIRPERGRAGGLYNAPLTLRRTFLCSSMFYYVAVGADILRCLKTNLRSIKIDDDCRRNYEL